LVTKLVSIFVKGEKAEKNGTERMSHVMHVIRGHDLINESGRG
jgi:hypothetical protein